jgi:hypothetical protein
MVSFFSEHPKEKKIENIKIEPNKLTLIKEKIGGVIFGFG